MSDPVSSVQVDVYRLFLLRYKLRPELFGDDRETPIRRIGSWLRRLDEGPPISPRSVRLLIEQFRLVDEATRNGSLRTLASDDETPGYASQTRPTWFAEWERASAMPIIKTIKRVKNLRSNALVPDWDEEFKHLPPATPRAATRNSLRDGFEEWLRLGRSKDDNPAVQVFDEIRTRHRLDPNDPEPTLTVKKINDHLAASGLPRAQQQRIKGLYLTGKHKKGGRPRIKSAR